MFCTNCGNKLPDNAKFCPSCGMPVPSRIAKDAVQAAEEAVGAAQETAEAVIAEAQEAAETAASELQEAAAEAVGAVQEAAEDAATEAAEAAETAAAEAIETAEEAAETVQETAEAAVTEAQETVQEAVNDTAEAAGELAETVTGAADEAAGEIREATEEAVTETQEAVQEAAEEAAEAVLAAEETADDAAEAAAEIPAAADDAAEAAAGIPAAAEETAEAAAEAVQEAAETVITEIQETAENAAAETAEAVQEAAEEVREIPAEETVQETFPVTAEQFTAPAEPFAQPQESVPFNPYVQAQAAPEAPQAPVNPYAADPSVPVQSPAQKSSGKKKGRGIIAALLALVLLAGAFFVYWNLPSTKFGRYVKQAAAAAEIENYEEAADLYHKALDIDPDSTEVSDALSEIYNAVQYRAVEAVYEGRYEDAISDARLMTVIDPGFTENNEYAMYDIYSTWVEEEAEAGNTATVETLLARADADLTPEYAEEVRTMAAEIKERLAVEDTLKASAVKITGFNSNSDYRSVFGELMTNLDNIRRYIELGGEMPFVVKDTEDTGVMFFYNGSRDAAQVYIGGILGDEDEYGYADTYYVSGVNTYSRSYEYFSAEEWSDGKPNGKFREINFHNEPDVPTDSNSDTVTGTLHDGKYEGEIVNRRSGYDYHMKFEYGTVIVLDTTDPNGDKGNVVGYTEDKNHWITFKDTGLTGNYGVRYLT